MEGNIAGVLNNVDFQDARLRVNITRSGRTSHIRASIVDAPKRVGSHLRHLVALLPPVYWVGAVEIEEAVNGYSLTGGVFTELSQVQFQTGDSPTLIKYSEALIRYSVAGEVVTMTHEGRGIDALGKLVLNIYVEGAVPFVHHRGRIALTPFYEDYIQTGLGMTYTADFIKYF